MGRAGGIDGFGPPFLREVPVIRARRVVASTEVARQATTLLRDHRVVVVATHGSFAVGHSLEEALSVTTALEMSAKIALMVRALGGAAHPVHPRGTRPGSRRRRRGL